MLNFGEIDTKTIHIEVLLQAQPNKDAIVVGYGNYLPTIKQPIPSESYLKALAFLLKLEIYQNLYAVSYIYPLGREYISDMDNNGDFFSVTYFLN